MCLLPWDRHITLSLVYMQSLPTGVLLEPQQNGNILAVSFVHETFKSGFSPKTLISLKEDYWSMGPRFFSTLSPNIMHLSPPPPPLPAFMHAFVLAFLFLLRNDSFHLCLCFHSLPKKSFLLKAPEYKGGIFMSLVHWNKNVMSLPLKILGQVSLTSSLWCKHNSFPEQHLQRCRNLLTTSDWGKLITFVSLGFSSLWMLSEHMHINHMPTESSAILWMNTFIVK